MKLNLQRGVCVRKIPGGREGGGEEDKKRHSMMMIEGWKEYEAVIRSD